MKQSKFAMREFIQKYIDEVKDALDTLDIKQINHATSLIFSAYEKGSRIFILGNGGSASTATHMACDLGKGTLSRFYDNKEKRLRVMSLADNVALLTAYANDLSFDHAFVQQLRNLVEKEDLVIVLSGSGNSINLIKAIKYAKDCGAKTIGILGFKTGGKLAELVDCSIVVQSNHYGPVEDVHLVMNHLLASCFAKIKREYDMKPAKNKALPYPTVRPQLIINGRQIKLITFDLEGTVSGYQVDSLHFAAHVEAAKVLGLELSWEDMDMVIKHIPHFIGGPDEKVHEEMLVLAEKRGIWSAKTKTARMKKLQELLAIDLEKFRELRDQLHEISPREGFVDFFAQIKDMGIPVAIGSLTNTKDSLALMNKLGLDKFFPEEMIVLGKHVPKRKPAPDVYLETARRGKCSPSEQLVFEDSHNGLLAATRAGSVGIGMPTIWKQEIVNRMVNIGRATSVFENWKDVNL